MKRLLLLLACGLAASGGPAAHRLVGQCFQPVSVVAQRPAGVSETNHARSIKPLATLPACALRYGFLMTDHWLTADLAQQIERRFLISGRAAPTAWRSNSSGYVTRWRPPSQVTDAQPGNWKWTWRLPAPDFAFCWWRSLSSSRAYSH